MIDKGQVELITPSISDETRQLLQNKYGKVLLITIDESYGPALFKTRRDDWSKIGGGLALKFRTASGSTSGCSTGGVVHRDGQHWILTAGHCTDAAASPFYQYDSTLGSKHSTFNAYDGGIDVGLIVPGGSPFSRYAHNGLFVGSRSASISDYNANMTGTWRVTSLNQTVCKSGITTGYTCGKVTDVEHFTKRGHLVSIAEKDPSQGYFAGQGDSGGSVTDSNNNLAGLVHGGSIVAYLSTGEGVGYNLYFTRWNEIGPRYDLNFYKSSSEALMAN